MKKSKVLLKAVASLLSLLLFCSAAVPAGATEIPDDIQTYYEYDPQTGTYVFKTGEEFYGEAKSVPASDNLLEKEPELPIFGEVAGEDFSIPESDLPDGTEESFTNGTDEGEDDGMEPILISATAGQHGYYEYDPETGTDIFKTGEEFNGVAEPVPASDDLLEEEFTVLKPYAVSKNPRTPVTNPTGRYASTCLVGARFNETIQAGTGWLINNDYVATVGHCIYLYNYGYADHVAVYVGASGGTSKQYRLGHARSVGGDFKSNSDTESTNYVNKGMFDDWGIVSLDNSVTVGVGHLGRYTVNSASDMKNRTYYTQGYPQDKNSNIPLEQWHNYVMYETSGTISGDRIQPRTLNLVLSNLEAYIGQSGSPVYSYRAGYGYAAEGMIVAGSNTYTAVILINNWFSNYINNL